MIAYSTSSFSTPARSSAARIAIAPSSVASCSARAPPSRPKGVRTAETITERDIGARVTSRLAAARWQRRQRLRQRRLVRPGNAAVAQPREEYEPEGNQHDERQHARRHDDPEGAERRLLRVGLRPRPAGVVGGPGLVLAADADRRERRHGRERVHEPPATALAQLAMEDDLADLARARGREHHRHPDLAAIG